MDIFYSLGELGDGLIWMIGVLGSIVSLLLGLINLFQEKKRWALASLGGGLILILLISTNSPYIRVPDVRDLRYDDARRTLIENDLKYFGRLEDAWIVVEQNPAPGKVVKKGTTIALNGVEVSIPDTTYSEMTIAPAKAPESQPHAPGLDISAVGDIVYLGSYQQRPNKKDDIRWEVLAIDGNQALILSEQALTSRSYHNQQTSVTWEESSMRYWLNEEFYYAAFSSEERELICLKTISNDIGADTSDYVFLLSLKEVKEYLPSNNARICTATQKAINDNAYVNSSTGGSWWWLRSQDQAGGEAASVNSDGKIDEAAPVSSKRGTVRPAMWVKIKK